MLIIFIIIIVLCLHNLWVYNGHFYPYKYSLIVYILYILYSFQFFLLDKSFSFYLLHDYFEVMHIQYFFYHYLPLSVFKQSYSRELKYGSIEYMPYICETLIWSPALKLLKSKIKVSQSVI